MDTVSDINYESDYISEEDEGGVNGHQYVLVPRGTFCNEETTNGTTPYAIGVYLLEVVYGFVDRKNILGDWHEVDTITVRYVHGINEEVCIPLESPELYMNCHIAYRLKFAPRNNRGERFQSDVRFINLEHFNPLEETNGKFVRLPVGNFATYPWTDAKYMIRVHNYVADEGTDVVVFPGKIRYIWYGFTDMTEEEYINRKHDVPWRNTFGEFKDEGVSDVVNQAHHHQVVQGDPNNKGFMMMNEIWVRLPNNSVSLVWKIGFEKFGGRGDEPSVYQGYHETQTFYFKQSYNSASRRSSIVSLPVPPLKS